MTLVIHHLTGCSPMPLANYLKGLGVLRLVAEQADPNARGWWQDEHFCLLTKLTREELEAFFLRQYEPTPLLSPWNKGCGFFKADDPGLAPLEASRASRFEKFRKGVVASRQLLDLVAEADAVIRAIKARTKTNKSFQTETQRALLERSSTFVSFVDLLKQQASQPELVDTERNSLLAELKTVQSLVSIAAKPPTKSEADRLKESSGYKRLKAVADRRFSTLKATLIPDCRRMWRGAHAEWLSAAVVLDEAGIPQWPSLLGTGGNDGNLDFTNNAMQRLVEIFEVDGDLGSPRANAAQLLANSLWSEAANQLTPTAIGQFQPGAAGGANSTTGPDGDSLVNPWDFLLMMEGAVLFSAQATRRLDPNAITRASAPFAVRPLAAGHASPGNEKAQRGEQWMPLWSQPALLREVTALLGEARVQLDRQTANRPVDVVRAISRLGVSRGIEAFTRYGYLERNGQSTLAVPLGRVHVRQHPRAHLVDDLAPWMDRLQRLARDKNASARLIHAERRLSNAVLAALQHDPTPDRWQAILLAAVDVESLQATGSAIEAGPIPPLRPEWVQAVDDGSPAVRLALALGSAAEGYAGGRRPFNPVRHHWLPLEPGARRFKTADKRLARDSRVVAFGRDPWADFVSIVDRRLIEAEKQAQRRLPIVAAPGCQATLSDLEAFLSASVDVTQVCNLSRAFMALKWDLWQPAFRPNPPHRSERGRTPDEAWLALRLACLSWPLEDGRSIPTEPSIVRRLVAGDSPGATQIAIARLRSAGVRSPLQVGTADPQTSLRWAAGLVFPIDRRTAQHAVELLDPSMKGLHHA
jgi:CRISPR-associated protein Csx17